MDDIGAIIEQLRMSTLLFDYDVQFLNSGEPEQLHCPFHHPDTNRSARFYPKDDHIYCFVCDKTWNVIDFVKDKEELTFGETLRFIKRHYPITVEVTPYEAQFYALRRPVVQSPEAMSETVERMFRKDAEALTSGELYSILGVYNECLAEKDDLTESGNLSHETLTQWYESSTARLRTETHNG